MTIARASPSPRRRAEPASSAELRKLLKVRERWDRYMGFAACALKKARVFELLGLASFRQYCQERLGLSASTVEKRARLENELWLRPAMRDAKAAGLTYAKLLLLTRLRTDRAVRAWTEKAKSMTCIQLLRELEADEDRHMRAQCRFEAPLQRPAAMALAAAIEAARKLSVTVITAGRALAIVAQHFVDTWKPQVRPAKTRSQKILERDVWCQVPGCSHRAGHAHHKKYRSQGGSDDPSNLMGVCPYHHQRSIHPGYLRLVVLEDSGEHLWLLGGETFTGGV